MRQNRRPHVRACGLVVAGFLLAACGHADEEHSPRAEHADPVPVALAPVERRPLPQTVPVTGTLFGDEHTIISAEVTGRIAEVLADVGDRVAPGQRLAQIDPTEYRLAVDERRAAMSTALSKLGLQTVPDDTFDPAMVPTVQRATFETANAYARVQRARQLFEQDPPLISEQDYQDLVTAHQVAEGNQAVALLDAQALLADVRLRQAELATAEQRLADTGVRAPAGAADTGLPRFGVVERRVSLGAYVTQGTPLYYLVADHPLKYRAPVPERFAGAVAVGQELTLALDSGSRIGQSDAGSGGAHPPIRGRVTRIAPAVDPDTRTFLVEAIIENPDRALRPGSFARGVIRVGERDAVVHLPRAAVVSFAGSDKAYSVSDGKAVAHTVTVLAREGDLWPIDEPLDAQTVIVLGAPEVAAGTPVRIVADGPGATPPTD